MGLEKVGTTISKEIIAWTRTNGSKSLLAMKPVKVNTCELKYIPKLESDVIQTTKKLIKADTTLFSWAKPKPEFSMTKVNPDSLALVHMTNYYPQNGQILSINSATRASEGIGCARTTIHFALNKPVTEHMLGNGWNTMNYAIIAPFKETVQGTPKSKVIGGFQDDFFFRDAVKLPKGSVIVKYNPKINPGELLVSDAFNGIKLVETSNRHMNETVSTVIQKMGYTTYNDALRRFLGASESEIKLLTSKPEIEVRESFMQIHKSGGSDKHKKMLEERLNSTIEFFTDIIDGEKVINEHKEIFSEEMKWLSLYEKFSEKFGIFPKTWKKFCAKNNYINGLHSQTAWFKAEMGITGIEIADKVNDNSWGKNLKQILIRSLNESESTLPKGKSLGYDIKKITKIIDESETPKIAKERIQKELKLKPMPPRQASQEFYDNDDSSGGGEALAEFMFNFLGLT